MAEQVFTEHAPRVYSLARRMLGNDADAEDVTQDVLLQVVRKVDTFRGESAFPTWLHRVTVNAALGLRRTRAARRERQVPDLPEPALGGAAQPGPTRHWCAPPDEQARGRELRRLIERAIDRLPPIYRDVLVLADVEGLPNAEVGGLLGLSVPAVKSRLHRGRLVLRDALAPHSG
jgi:RNA polymerase sigma-70 factor (ECF subfamily)